MSTPAPARTSQDALREMARTGINPSSVIGSGYGPTGLPPGAVREGNFTIYNKRVPGQGGSHTLPPMQAVQDLPPGVSNVVPGMAQFGTTGSGYGIDPALAALLMGGGYNDYGYHPIQPNNRFDGIQQLRSSGAMRRQRGKTNRAILGAPSYPMLDLPRYAYA